jgi:hypothetical protein
MHNGGWVLCMYWLSRLSSSVVWRGGGGKGRRASKGDVG